MSYIKYISKPYDDENCLYNVINYCMSNDDIEFYDCFGINPLSMNYMAQSMSQVQKRYNKDEGKKLHHLVVSVYPKHYMNIDKKKVWARLIVSEVGNLLLNLGYQNIGFVHVCDQFNCHIHLVINSVNYANGKKITNVRSFCNEVLHYLRVEYPSLNWENVLYSKENNF